MFSPFLTGILVPKYNHEAVYAEVGSSMTLPCIFSDGLNVGIVFWNKVPSTTTRPDIDLPSFMKTHSQWDKSYHIENVEEADKGVYVCSGEIKGRNWSRVERSINLVTARGV